MQTEVTELSIIERSKLENLEMVIDQHIDTCLKVANALRTINVERLYRETHSTFDEYVKSRFPFQTAHAYRLIEYADVADAVSPVGEIPNERQARELAKLPDDEKKDVWEKVVKDGKPTANAIKEEIERRLSPKCQNCGGEEWASDDDGEFCPKCKEPGPAEPRVIERDLSADQEPVISRTQRNKAANLRAEADVVIRQVIDAWPADDFEDLDAWWKGWRKEIKKGSN